MDTNPLAPLPEVVGEAGVIVPAKSVDALADAIGDLLQDEQRRTELSAAGRQRILEKFSWQVCAAEMVNYYRLVLDRADS